MDEQTGSTAPERHNAIRNGNSFNCPTCFRARSLIQNKRDQSIWRCGNERVDGCFTQFRFVPGRDSEFDTLVRIREPREVRRVSDEELARIRGGVA